MKIIISIDDVNPKPDWQILSTPVEGWLRSLNQKYGARFTCFIPSNYHGEFPLSKNKEWIRELNSIPWIECAAHGHLHMTSAPTRFGECEFYELDTWRSVDNRMGELKKEWDSIGVQPRGWKPPGWLCSLAFNDWMNSLYLSEKNWFKYVSLHCEHNHGMNWNCKTFFGHDGIHQTNISIHNDDMIMLTSHIAGDWNDNVWNQANYDQLCHSLDYLVENYECEFKTLKECL